MPRKKQAPPLPADAPSTEELREVLQDLIARFRALGNTESVGILEVLLQSLVEGHEDMPIAQHSDGSPSSTVQQFTMLVTERFLEALESLERKAELRRRRVPTQIHLGIQGYETVQRTARMAKAAAREKDVLLTVADRARIEKFSPGTLNLPARIAFLALVQLLTQNNTMPRLANKREAVDLDTRIPLAVRGGYSELADVLGWARNKQGRHAGSKRALLTKGMKDLEKPRELVHIFDAEWDPATHRHIRRMVHVKAALIEVRSEGTVEEGAQGELFYTPFTQFVSLHPLALLGARAHYREVPGDFISRYEATLHQLATEAKRDAKVRKVMGRNPPRMLESDLEFLLWCYMGRSVMRITRDHLMDRIGLGKLLRQRKVSRANRWLDRALLVGERMGAYLAVAAGKGDGVLVFTFRADLPEEPADLEGGTIPLPLEGAEPVSAPIEGTE